MPTDMPIPVAGADRAVAIRFAIVAVVVAELVLCLHPTGFSGGPSDDQQYLDTALAWYRDGPQAGTTHWALRAPLIAAIDALFHIAGPGLAALLAVPRLFYALFVAAAAAAVTRAGGVRAGTIWLVLAAVSPVLHEMATSCYPEIVELSLGTVSLAAFLAARRRIGVPRHAAMAVAGVALGLAILTRETAAFLAVGYVWAALARPAGGRGAYLTLGAALALPIAADIVWLWSLTGDWLYRLHVDQNHTHIFSAHLRGGVYTGGRVFLNPDLAGRWLPAGPTRLWWPLNPLDDFLIDPRFGFAILALAIAAAVRRGGAAVPSRALLWAVAIGCYLTVTWVFTLRPQPRYYLPVVAAAQVALAFVLADMLARGLRRRAAALVALCLVGGAVPILLTRDAGLAAKRAVPWIAAHPGPYAVTPYNLATRIGARARLAGLPAPAIGDPPPGGYRLTQVSHGSLRRTGGQLAVTPGYRDVTLLYLDRPWLEAAFKPKGFRAIRVEQRTR